MPRSVLEIDVDDSKFKAFMALYGQYQAELPKLSQFWQGATASIEDAADATGKVADATDRVVDANGKVVETTAAAAKSAASMDDVVAAIAASTALIVEGMTKTASATERADRSMKSTAGHAKSIATSVAHTTANIAKWATLSLGVGLIGGGAGLFGLDALANAVSGQRKSALGLGITTGEQQAFDVNFGTRLVGSDFLAGVQGVKSDLAQQWQFSALGIPQGEVEQADTAALGIDVIQRAHKLWGEAGPGGHNQQWMQAHGLSGFVDFPTWQRIGQASPEDLKHYEEQYRKDAQTMGAPNQTQIDWQNFAAQMKRAGDQIEAIFVKGLDPLIPALTKLSESVEKTLAGFLSNPHLKEWIEDFGRGIEFVGEYLGSDKFQSDIKSTVDGFAYAAEKIVAGLKLLGLIPSTTPDGAPGYGVSPQQLTGAPDPRDEDVWKKWRKWQDDFWHWLTGGTGEPQSSGAPSPSAAQTGAALPSIYNNRLSDFSMPGSPGHGMDFAPLEKATGLPAGLLRSLGMQESSLNPDVPDVWAHGVPHQGMFQMSPDMQRQWGVTDPRDPDQESKGTAREMAAYMKEYEGNVAKAIAANYEGEGAVAAEEAQAKMRGGNWLNYAKPDVQQYVASVAQRINVQVSVLNQTGAQVAVAANAVRQ